MAESQAVIVGGGIAAVPAFDATDESIGRGVFVSSDTPPAVRAAVSFGQDSTGHFWAQSGLTSAQSVTNQQRGVFIGRAMANLATAITGTVSPVIIGRAAGVNITGGTVIASGVAIGDGAITDADAVCIGRGSVVNCNSGADNPIVINCSAVLGTAVTSGVYMGMGGGGAPDIRDNAGIYIMGHNNGVAAGNGMAIFGIVQGNNGMCVGRLSRCGGDRGVALGPDAVACAIGGTQYHECIAVGSAASAVGTGATGNRRSIAIGVSAVATCDNATANAIAIGTSASATASGATGAAVAIGPSATAATGQAVIGATGFPLELRIIAAAAGERLRVDATAVAGNTALMLYDVDNNTLERVTVGAADSGGAGFKLLRIPN